MAALALPPEAPIAHPERVASVLARDAEAR
jgi:hypothetical protein